ncbi:hypothetical protein [Flexivirga meconopsidis]|uniref:hypothetical protein n=1 Tax=Flexivirga meconopsidis TaxID=2977121 RepID=UPI00223F226C|nr:hypothetical protein [Flexivirga meconopsidis]
MGEEDTDGMPVPTYVEGVPLVGDDAKTAWYLPVAWLEPAVVGMGYLLDGVIRIFRRKG